MDVTAVISQIEMYLLKYPEDIHGSKTLDFVKNTPDFWKREHLEGHLTASAWVLSMDKSQTLLTHHKGLDSWFQLGGHIEPEDSTVCDAALREIIEESGIEPLESFSNQIFDIDVHWIPENKKGVPGHFHYDVRYLFFADDGQPILFDTNESNEVCWVSIANIEEKSSQESVLRMVRKS